MSHFPLLTHKLITNSKRCIVIISPPKYIKNILITLESHEFEAYLVGGCVRDMLLNRYPQDWDICTNALPEQIMEIFPDTLPTGLKHGTVTVIQGRHSAEVTTYRTEGTYSDHRRPDAVQFVTDLTADLARRDFTMNAIAVSARGLVADPFGGIEDIEKKTIRCVGDPEKRFREDALRMFRAYRFSARLGFAIEAETNKAIADCSSLASALAPERIRDELGKILRTDRTRVLGHMIRLGLMNTYLEGDTDACPDFRILSATPRKSSIRWCVFAIVLRQSGLIRNVAVFLTLLRLDRTTIRTASAADEIFSRGLSDRRTELMLNMSIYGVDAVKCAYYAYDALYGTRREKEVVSVLKSGDCFSLDKLAVSGEDLLSLGYKGPELGRMLQFLLEYVIQYPQNNTRETLLNIAAKDSEYEY